MHTPWTPEEDECLRTLVDKYHGQHSHPWLEIAERMPGDRNNDQCRNRWQRLSGAKKDNLWTAEEDECLRALVEAHGEHGELSWGQIAERMPYERNENQCCNRWRRL